MRRMLGYFVEFGDNGGGVYGGRLAIIDIGVRPRAKPRSAFPPGPSVLFSDIVRCACHGLVVSGANFL